MAADMAKLEKDKTKFLALKKKRGEFEIPDTQKIDWTGIYIYTYISLYTFTIKDEPKCRWKKAYIECLGIRKNMAMAMAKLPLTLGGVENTFRDMGFFCLPQSTVGHCLLTQPCYNVGP